MAIPKTIHYCWFGHNPKGELIERCIQSWKETCPDFEIKEWTEENFDVEVFPFAKRMYQEKKWAFVADYARLEILLKEGGFYLDTDMFLRKSLSPFTHHECVLGEESIGIISAGMIASVPHHPYIMSCKEFYDTCSKEIITIPRALTQVFVEFPHNETIVVLPPKTFYPFDAEHIHEYKGQDLGDDVYGVHLWNYSWGHPLNKFFKKIRIYTIGKKIVEVLGIKKILKKLLGFI